MLSLDDFRTPHWGRSQDGGATWSAVDDQDVPRAPSGDRGTLICVVGNVCYRYNPYIDIIERSDPSGGWQLDYASSEPLEGLVVNPADDTQAMVMVNRGAVSRGADGTWRPTDFTALTAGPRWQSGVAAFFRNPLTTLALAGVLCAGGLAWGRWREPAGTLWVVVNVSVAVLLTLASSASSDLARPIGAWIGAALAFLAARRAWDRRVRRADGRGEPR